MKNERLQQLLNYLTDDPGDPFLIYAVAMEYKPTDPDQAMEYLRKLLNDHPDYIPTYYHAAEILVEKQGREDDIKAVFEKGITVAREAGDHKALQELKTAYTNWEFENL